MTVRRMSVTGAKSDFSGLLNRVAYGRERIIVESRGKPKVAVVPMEDYETLEELEDMVLGLRATERMNDGQALVPVAELIARYEQAHGVSLGLAGED